MDPIGGYFSLELPLHEEYHKDALRLNTGRNCLEYILQARQYTKVYIPYYTCEVILEPFKKLSIDYEFYHIDLSFELSVEIKLESGEALLYTNYFGLKQRYAETLARLYGHQLIIDNTQAFYSKPIEGIDTFYSCRKFFGVPDGAYLYTDTRLDGKFEQDVSYKRMTHLLKRIDLSAEDGYADFRKIDESLENQPVKKMSKLTQRMMQSINYTIVAKKRRANYLRLHKVLQVSNQFKLSIDDDAVPMIYPYLSNKEGFREILLSHKVFVARYWLNVLEWGEKDCTEERLVMQMAALPIDQRYGKKNMDKISSLINL